MCYIYPSRRLLLNPNACIEYRFQRYVDEPYKTIAGNVIPVDGKPGAVAFIQQQNRNVAEINFQRSRPTRRSRFVVQFIIGDIFRFVQRRGIPKETEVTRKSTATTAFGYYTGLRVIFIECAFNSNIVVGVFDDVEYLEVLSLRNNRISFIRPGLFSNMRRLVYLDLTKNWISLVSDIIM